MGKHEVTQAQYRQLMGTNPSYFIPTQTNYSRGYPNTDNQPVEQVTWYDAVRFCNALSLNQGLTTCYSNQIGSSTIANNDTLACNWSATGYRLPTEAEWEYACRVATTSRFYWANSYYEAQTKQYAWFYHNANGWTTPHAEKGGTQPVGTRTSNGFGLYDMSGNVGEWCWDWCEAYPSGTQTDPRGAASGTPGLTGRVSRGGSWNSPDYRIRCAERASYPPENNRTDTGIRVCRWRF